MNELKELRRSAHDNSRISKEKIKMAHDELISCYIFHQFDKLLLYDSRLHLFTKKLCMFGPFVNINLYPHRAIDIENPKNG